MTKYRVWATYVGEVEANSAEEVPEAFPLDLRVWPGQFVVVESVDVIESHLLDSYTEGK